MRISVSQIETFKACNRKWWHERVMNRGKAESTNVFGTVLHACLERALKNQPVYPVGWESSYDRFSGEETGRLSNNEQAQVKMLVTKAADAGWLDPRDVQVEREFKVAMGDDELIGFVDVVRPDRRYVVSMCPPTLPGERDGLPKIEDHKSTSAMKWAETEESLADNTQLLVYAKVIHPDADWVTLRHNVFCKNPVSIKRVEVTVNRERIDKEWEEVSQAALAMSALREVRDIDKVTPNPKECSNWGGCPFKVHCYPEDDY